MKKENSSYRATIKRVNYFKLMLYSMVYVYSSIPRGIVECFLKRNQGERTFSLVNSILSLIIMTFIPLISEGILRYNLKRGFYLLTRHVDMADFFLKYTTWYLFLIAFLFAFIKRNDEVRYGPSIYKLGQHTLYPGDPHPLFRSLMNSGYKITIRTVETLLEPGVFVIAGLLLMLLNQPIGKFLVCCGFIYSLSLCAAYRVGDEQIMDLLDKIVEAEEKKNILSGKGPEDTRGANSPLYAIEDPSVKQKASNVIDSDDTDYEVS